MWLMPSYGRPEALHRLLSAPGGWPAEVIVLVNEDDPERQRYQQSVDNLAACNNPAEPPSPWHILVVPAGSRFADAVRWAYQWAPDAPFYGIIDDDYWPVTPGWHQKMVEAAGPNAIAIANNRQNFPTLYTCRVMGGELARAIGTIAPGRMRHNFSDDAWGRFAEDFRLLRPIEDVIVEHRHHMFDKSVPKDATYERGSGHDFEEDRARYHAWLKSPERKNSCERVAALLGGACSVKDLSAVHLAICTPMQRMEVDFAFFNSYLRTMLELQRCGVRFTTFPTAGGSNIGKSRENLLWKVMANPSITHLLWIDDDMGWDPHLPVRLIMADHDFCAAAGVRKTEELSLCFNPLPGPARFHATTKFLEVRDVGFAFVMLKRQVIERMTKVYSELRYNTGDRPAEYALFLETIDRSDGPHGERLSEDFSFCRRWRAIGGEIWVDPDAALIHAGRKEYTGRPRDAFRTQAPAEDVHAA